jgi:hypothetical protein
MPPVSISVIFSYVKWSKLEEPHTTISYSQKFSIYKPQYFSCMWVRSNDFFFVAGFTGLTTHAILRPSRILLQFDSAGWKSQVPRPLLLEDALLFFFDSAGWKSRCLDPCCLQTPF